LTSQISRLVRDDGASLLVRHWQSNRPSPHAIIQIAHGMSEHSGRYEPFAKMLTTHGYGVIAHDHRGHGETTAPNTFHGHTGPAGSWQHIMGDMLAVNQQVAAQYTGTPLVVFGHSMGATIATDFLLREPNRMDAAAIWNGSKSGFLPNLLNGLLGFERMLKGSDAASTWANSLTFRTWNKEFAPNRTDSDWLSRDQEEVDLYISDPLCGFHCTIATWKELLGALATLSDVERHTVLSEGMAIHLLNGGADPCSAKGMAATQMAGYFKRAGLADVTSVILPDTRHESLNEINRNSTIAQFIAWLNERFA